MPVGLRSVSQATAQPRNLPAVPLVHEMLSTDLRCLVRVEQSAAAGLPVTEIAQETDDAAANTARCGIAALRVHPQVDASRIGMLDFGEGGRAAIHDWAGQDPFAAHAIHYPDSFLFLALRQCAL